VDSIVNEPPKDPQPEQQEKFCFVDEAGDPVLFSGSGQVLIGTNGCSRFFALGVLDVADPARLASELTDLRNKLIADPFFATVPSMSAADKKTALAFHAKDDLPEVRREVFQLLLRHDIKFSAIVRDKAAILSYVRGRNQNSSTYRYNPNELYDYMVRRLFKERLHKHSKCHIFFARRGNSDRTAALTKALHAARTRFTQSTGIASASEIFVIPASPLQQAPLQATDYFLWALQRAFERGEDRYLQYVWGKCSLIVDADDTRHAKYGEFYTQKKPLTSAALKTAEGYRIKSPK
jgi:hypothetical protein